jgi:hypothetical protein
MAAKKATPKAENPYIGWDKNSDGKREGTERFVSLCARRWNAKNLGTWNVRNIRGKDSPSVHGTGRAMDILIEDKDLKAQAIAWFTRPDVVAGLGIQAVHVYNAGVWGKAWRIGRGWKQWTSSDNGGSKGARWLHVEIDNSLADNASEMERVWRSLPKP